MRLAIYALKYNDRPDVARSLARLLVPAAQAVAAGVTPVVIPVPLHSGRLDARGYNQAERLATHLARECGWPLVQSIMRIRDTATQVGLGRDGRRANVSGAFAATARMDGKDVLLVDDVMTTGATLMEVARACRLVGAASVIAVCAARNLADDTPSTIH
jgi:ComF family protein